MQSIMTRFFTILFLYIPLLSCWTTLQAQGNSEMYLFSLQKTGKGEYHLHTPRYLSKFNEGGYTNQPSFTPDGDVLVSVRKAGDSQNDIFQLSLKNWRYKQLTKTTATEYSPSMHPDEEHITVVRKVGEDPMDQQIFNIDLRNREYVGVSGDIRDVGFYTWLRPGELGLFRIEGTGSRLSYFNVNENKSRRITTSIGRTLASDKDGWLIYVHKFTDKYWYIKKYNPATSTIEIVTQTIGNNEDFALASDGTYFMSDKHLLYTFHPDLKKEWVILADLSLYGIKFISRIAISPDAKHLILVTSKEKQ